MAQEVSGEGLLPLRIGNSAVRHPQLAPGFRGHRDGDTLAVDTTNCSDTPVLAGASRNLHVVEETSRIGADTLPNRFMAEDPAVWSESWGAVYVWPATASRPCECSSQEANCCFGGILRGARPLKAEALDKSGMPEW